MSVQEMRQRMIRGPERRVLSVAGLAAPRVIDHGVAYQAIRHLGQRRGRDGIGLFQAAMAGFTGICRRKKGLHGRATLKVAVMGDRLRQQRSQIAHPQVQGVTEMDYGSGWRPDAPRRLYVRRMAAPADSRGREQVVLGARTARCGRVAAGAGELHLEMKAMRERCGALQASAEKQEAEDSHPPNRAGRHRASGYFP
jgi:hypothetical protein